MSRSGSDFGASHRGGRPSACPHGRPRGLVQCSDCEWELERDRYLDGLTDEHLVYLSNSIDVTLGERGWASDRDRIWRKDE